MTDAPTGPQPSLGKEEGFALVPHPDFPSRAITAVNVTAERNGGSLTFWFTLVGDIDQVSLPGPCSDCIRADGLWEHTCFEAFVCVQGRPGYSELNYAPSGQWAAYSFDAYRKGMRNLESSDGEPFVQVGYRGGMDDWHAWEFQTADAFEQQAEWQLGLSAIIEAKDGSKSYWALSHAPGPPDFHNRDCFTARLAAPTRS
ncbi:MAG: DOMON-like domain-containing protein [Sphingomonas bacterium]